MPACMRSLPSRTAAVEVPRRVAAAHESRLPDPARRCLTPATSVTDQSSLPQGSSARLVADLVWPGGASARLQERSPDCAIDAVRRPASVEGCRSGAWNPAAPSPGTRTGSSSTSKPAHPACPSWDGRTEGGRELVRSWFTVGT